MTLEDRILYLEDIHEITNLKADYCNLCDGGWDRPAMGNPEAVAALFTEDGIWDIGVVPVAQGHDGIVALLRSMQTWPFAFHNHVVPSIHLEGNEAKAKWHGINLVTIPGMGGQWSVGIYDEEYRRTAKGWKFSMVKFMRIFRTPFDVDWSRNMDIFQHDALAAEYKSKPLLDNGSSGGG